MCSFWVPTPSSAHSQPGLQDRRPAGQTRVLQAEESAFRRDKRQPGSSSRQRWVLQHLHLNIKANSRLPQPWGFNPP